MHLWALNLNLTDNAAFVNFFTNAVNTLPCHNCRGHAQEYLQDHPLYPSSVDRGWAFKYTVDMHNSVNERKGKEKWSYDKAKTYYLDLISRGAMPGCIGCGEDKSNIIDDDLPPNIILRIFN